MVSGLSILFTRTTQLYSLLNFLWKVFTRGNPHQIKSWLIVAFVQALTVNDLQHVYETLHTAHASASPHWFNLGLALGVTYFVLTNIDSKHRGDNVSCLREMLAELLSTQNVTWSLLSDALKKPTVKLNNLADSITGNYFQYLRIYLFISLAACVSFLVLDIDYHYLSFFSFFLCTHTH